MMIGLRCEIFIELCAEAFFFEQIPHALFAWTLGVVQGHAVMHRRLGRHVMRKGNKFSLWVDEGDATTPTSTPTSTATTPTSTATTIFANYLVEGERGCAKIILQVEQAVAHAEKKLILLLAEFSNGDKFVLFELNERPQLPAM